MAHLWIIIIIIINIIINSLFYIDKKLQGKT